MLPMFKPQSALVLKELNTMTESLTRQRWGYNEEGYCLNFPQNNWDSDLLSHNIQTAFESHSIKASSKGNGFNAVDGTRLIIDKDCSLEVTAKVASELQRHYPTVGCSV